MIVMEMPVRMSRKYMAADKDIAKYFVPAAQIREFVDKLMVQ